MKILFKNAMCFYKNGFHPLDVSVSNGKIEEVRASIPPIDFDSVFDIEGKYLIPGFVDVHVHLREPGFSYKETIKSGTLAAAKGGYTAVCSMPNLNPAPDSAENLKVQTDIIDRDALIRVYPMGTITKGQKGSGELSDIEALKDNVIAFSDDGKGVQSDALMEEAMRKIKSFGGIIAAHCEDERELSGGYVHDGEYAKRNGHKGINSESEYLQVKRDLELIEKIGLRYHVCHVSTAESVNLIREAKKKGLPVSCETGPHYLTMCDEDIKDEGRFKMNPPIRSDRDRRALIEGIIDGTVDMIATDHAPHSAEEKGKGLEKSLMGVVGLETAFSVLYTELVMKKVITLEKLIELMCVAPRRVFNIPGGIDVGNDADLAVLDLESQYVINSETFLSMGKATPFENKKVFGENIKTFVGGKLVWEKK